MTMNRRLPLTGVRVLDLSRLLPGPYATMLLADLGATVDKVEDLGAGDYLRRMPPQDAGENPIFQALNRGKRSLALDLKSDAGRTAFERLVPGYDVLVESFRPGVMDRLGLGYDKLAALHPGLIYCAISGYGQNGPLRDRAGHDLNYQARSGALALTGPSDRPPQVPGVQIADIAGGALFATVRILAALHGRPSNGDQGEFIDISMCEGALAVSLFGLLSQLGGMPLPRGDGLLMGGIAPYGTYETSDHKFVSLAALEPKFWNAFCAGVNLSPDMEALAPGPHQVDWKRRIAEAIRGRTRAEWEAFAAQNDCCLEPVLEPEELLQDPQHRAREVFATELRPGGPPSPLTPAGKAHGGPAPSQGEHGATVLGDAGFTAEEIDLVRAAGAIPPA